MLRILSTLIPLIVCGLIFSCKKDDPVLPTTMKGTVVDSETGQPVSSARILFSVIVPYNRYPGTTSVLEGVTADANGAFAHTFRYDAIDAGLWEITAPGYLYKHVGFQNYSPEMGKTSEFTIPIIRSTSTLKLHIKNETGLQQSVYMEILRPTPSIESGYPYVYSPKFEQGQEEYRYIKCMANEYTTISWSLENFVSNQLMPMHQDNFLMPLNDTVEYSIIY